MTLLREEPRPEPPRETLGLDEAQAAGLQGYIHFSTPAGNTNLWTQRMDPPAGPGGVNA